MKGSRFLLRASMLLVGFAVVLCGAFVRYAPKALESLIRSELSKINASEIEIQNISPYFGGVKLGEISLRLKQPDYDLSVSLSDIQVRATLAAIRERKISSVSAESGTLSLALSSVPIQKSGTRLGPIKIPIESVSISALKFGVTRDESLSLSGVAGLHLGIEEDEISGEIETSDVSIKAPSIAISGLRGPIRFKMAAKKLAADGDFSADDLPAVVNTHLFHDFTSGLGSFKTDPIELSLLLADKVTSSFAVLKTIPVKFNNGVSVVGASLAWNEEDPLSGAVSFDIKNSSGSSPYGEFTGANIVGTVHTNGTTTAPIQIYADQFNSLTPISSSRTFLSVSYPGPLLTFSRSAAALLGGGIESSKITFNLETKHGSADLRVVGVNIAEILKLYPQEKISAAGKLSGELKLSFAGQTIPLLSGKLVSVPPGGEILYDVDNASLPDNPQLNMAFRALEQFQFTTLAADLSSKPNGDLTIGVHLEGRSPKVNKDQPINVNLNIEENLPALVKSLRIAGEVGNMFGGESKK